jgi:hypothetical protein
MKGQLTEGEYRELLTLLALFHPTGRADVERHLLYGGEFFGKGRKLREV